MEEKKSKKIINEILLNLMRVGSFFSAVLLFLPSFNPARITQLINKNMSIFTSAVSFEKLTSEAIRAMNNGWVFKSDFIILNISSIVLCLGIILVVIGASLSIGNIRFKRLSSILAFGGSLLQFGGLAGIYFDYTRMSMTPNFERVLPAIPNGFYVFLIVATVLLILSIALFILLPVCHKNTPYEMARSSQLFLMFLPFAALIFVFSYLPLWGWRYAFFNFRPGIPLTMDDFVGFYWFKVLFSSTGSDIFRVLINTFAMSGLGLAFSWLPMVFAVFLAEITSSKFKRIVQLFTTIPNFISWVLVYALALAIFSTDGFINGMLTNVFNIPSSTNYLMGDDGIWLKMWAWGTWKSLGWSAIIYIAAISGIDPVMYEAATIDGANRFQKMRFITIPSLLPTYFVLLVLSVANILSNGMDQYLVFENSTNTLKITVLDLYVYQIGLDKGLIPLSTVVGMLKSIISVVLLMTVNGFSKVVRGESVV